MVRQKRKGTLVTIGAVARWLRFRFNDAGAISEVFVEDRGYINKNTIVTDKTRGLL